MRVMVIVKATPASEAGTLPSTELLTAMGQYNEELVKAGVMVAGEGLHPSARGKRVRMAGGERTVVDGPFPETNQLVAGFWLWQVSSMDEAVEWARRCPDPMPGGGELELRPVVEADDFGADFTPELREQEERLRRQLAEQRNALDQLTNTDSRAAAALEEARQRAEAIGILNGTIAARGPGLEMTIRDPEDGVRVADLLDAIQELRGAGAETMQIDGVRVGVSTAVTGEPGSLFIDGRPITAP